MNDTDDVGIGTKVLAVVLLSLFVIMLLAIFVAVIIGLVRVIGAVL